MDEFGVLGFGILMFLGFAGLFEFGLCCVCWLGLLLGGFVVLVWLGWVWVVGCVFGWVCV